MSCKPTINVSLPVQPIGPNQHWPFLQWLDRAVSLCLWLHERQRQRKALLDLDDHLLDDIGVTRKKALEVGKRPFWR